MKVLHNSFASIEPYIFNCKECSSKLETLPSDYKFVFDPRDGDALVCTCPVCKTENWINTNNFTRKFKAAVK